MFELMKAFCFDPEIAVTYGVDAAVMIWNLDFWIQKNKANGKHFHDGFWWTYNTAQAFTELFPFWTAKQITRILAKLEDAGVIHTGNYNQTTYDRTKWYALDYEVLLLSKTFSKTGKCISPNGQMDLPELANGFAGTGEPKPNNEANINPNSKHISSKRPARAVLFEDSEIATWDAFVSKFGTDEYAGADIRYYYDTIKDWAAAKGAKYKDWIAFVRNWMRRDFKDGKLVKVQATPGDVLSDGAKQYLAMGMEDELWPNL